MYETVCVKPYAMAYETVYDSACAKEYGLVMVYDSAYDSAYEMAYGSDSEYETVYGSVYDLVYETQYGLACGLAYVTD